MGFILKKEYADEIRAKYKSSYLKDKIGLSATYMSLIINRKREIPKRIAYSFAKAIDSNYEINDIFEQTR